MVLTQNQILTSATQQGTRDRTSDGRTAPMSRGTAWRPKKPRKRCHLLPCSATCCHKRHQGTQTMRKHSCTAEKGTACSCLSSSRPQPDVQLYAQQFQGFVPQGRCLIMSSQLPFNQPGPSASRWPRLNHNEEELLLADHHLTRYSWK